MIELQTTNIPLSGHALRSVRVVPYIGGVEQVAAAGSMLYNPATGEALAWFAARPGNPAQTLAVSALPVSAVVACSAPGLAAAASCSLGADVELHVELTTSAVVPQLIAATVPVEVTVDTVAAARTVLAVELPTGDVPRIAGQQVLSSGSFPLTLKRADSRVYLLAVDEWGLQFQAAGAVAIGDLVRPSQFSGLLYRVTAAGILPATEPEWWDVDAQETPHQLGTAQAVAVRHYRPLAHGPVPVTVS